MKKSIALLMVLLVVILITAVAVSGCGGPTPEEAEATFKTDLQNLQTAFTALSNPSNYASIDSFKSAWNEVEVAFDEVVKSAKDVKDANVTALKSAWDDLSSSIESINDTQSLGQKLDTLTQALQDFQKALQDLMPTGQ